MAYAQASTDNSRRLARSVRGEHDWSLEGDTVANGITAELTLGGRRSRVHFETRVENSGRLSVKE